MTPDGGPSLTGLGQNPVMQLDPGPTPEMMLEAGSGALAMTAMTVRESKAIDMAGCYFVCTDVVNLAYHHVKRPPDLKPGGRFPHGPL